VSVCPHCRQPTPLLNGVWVCEPCEKRWPIGPLMRIYECKDGLCSRHGYDREAWDGLVEMLTMKEEE
jgi:hypothetical protein